MQNMCDNIVKTASVGTLSNEIDALQKQLAYVCSLRKQTEELIELVDNEETANEYREVVENKFNCFKTLQSTRMEQIKSAINNKASSGTDKNIVSDREVKKSEFSIGTKILGIIGMLFVLIAAVIFGSMVMLAVSDAVKSLILMGLGVCITMLGYVKTTRDDRSILGKLLLGGGLGLLYLSVYFGYATFEIISGITMLVMIIGLTIISWGISKITDSKWVVLLTSIGCYLPCLTDMQIGSDGYVLFSVYLIIVSCLIATMVQGKNWIATVIVSSTLSAIANTVFLCISSIPEQMYSVHVVLVYMVPVIVTCINMQCDTDKEVKVANKLLVIISAIVGGSTMLVAAMDAVEFILDADSKTKALMYFSSISGIVIISVVSMVAGLIIGKRCGRKDVCALALKVASVLTISTIAMVVGTNYTFGIVVATIALITARLSKEDGVGIECESISVASLASTLAFIIHYLSNGIEDAGYMTRYATDHWHWIGYEAMYGIGIATSAIVFVASIILIETSRHKYRAVLPVVSYISIMSLLYYVVDSIMLKEAIKNGSGLISGVLTILALTLPLFNVLWIVIEYGTKLLGDKANKKETKIGFLITLGISIVFQFGAVSTVTSDVLSLDTFDNMWVLKALVILEVLVYTVMLSMAFERNLRNYPHALRFILKEVVIFIVGITQLAIVIGEDMMKLPISCAFILLGIMWIYRGFKSGKSYVRISGLVSIILGVAKSTFIDVLATDNTFLILGFYFFGGLILLGIAAAYNKALKNIDNQ